MVELVDKTQMLIAQTPLRSRVQMAQNLTPQGHLPGAGRIQAAQQMQQGAFAGTGSPHNRHRLPGPDLKIYALQNRHIQPPLLEPFAQGPAFQQDRGACWAAHRRRARGLNLGLVLRLALRLAFYWLIHSAKPPLD